jgi:hypothetical protein
LINTIDQQQKNRVETEQEDGFMEHEFEAMKSTTQKINYLRSRRNSPEHHLPKIQTDAISQSTMPIGAFTAIKKINQIPVIETEMQL